MRSLNNAVYLKGGLCTDPFVHKACWLSILSPCCHPVEISLVACNRYYSLFTLGMLVMFECTVVGQRLRNLRELRSLTVPKQALQVYRQGRWDQLPGDALLPGDVIAIGRPSGGEIPS